MKPKREENGPPSRLRREQAVRSLRSLWPPELDVEVVVATCALCTPACRRLLSCLCYAFYERARLAPYELTHVRAPSGDRAWRKRRARFESSEALEEQLAVARSAVELLRCCARVSRAAALVRQHIDGVARASSAGTKSGSSARSLVLLNMLASVSRTARLGDQLYSSTTK